MNVLVRSRESAVASRWAAILKEAGHQVLGPASTPDQAMQLEERTRPDLIVAHIDLTAVGGTDVARDIVLRFRTPTLVMNSLPLKPPRLEMEAYVH